MARPIFLTLVLLLSSVTSLHASDGVLEINQTCAVNTGCFSGDAMGFPVTIDGSAGRSYRLTGDLVVPDGNTRAIYVTTPDIGIDLNGFTIIGVACVGEITSGCRPTSGIGVGVMVDRLALFGISVSNGSIVGMGYRGVSLGYQAEVRDLRVRWNRSDGIYVDRGSTVSGSTAYENGIGISGTGIQTAARSLVESNVVVGTGGIGVQVRGGSVVSGNTIGSSSGAGLDCVADGAQCSYAHNSFSANAGGSVTGSELKATGGNTCDDGLCASARKYYLTQTDTHDGANTLTACASRYHMASLWEIFGFSEFEYDIVRGQISADSGRGPPAKTNELAWGWVRTGELAGTFNPGNCLAQSSNDPNHDGRLAVLTFGFNLSSAAWVAPLFLDTRSCDETHRVWCLQD